MRKHTGVHPRMGAVDVCPFVLLDDEKFQAAFLKAVDQFIEHMGAKGLPIYTYEHSASKAVKKKSSARAQGRIRTTPLTVRSRRFSRCRT